MRAFLHQWFTTDRLASLSKDANLYPSFDASMAASMGSELDLYFDGVLWSGTGSLRELFTSNRSFVDSALAALYGVTAPGPGFQPVTLDAPLRSGILARAGFLAVHAANDGSAPITRGVFVLQSIMCSPPPARPADVPAPPAANDPSVQGSTTRQRFERHVSSPFCASCHTRIDGVGFGFEAFDGIGAHRATENGQPVDSRGTVEGTGEIDGDFTGVAELATKLAGSRLLADCYAKQAYRYAMGQVEDSAESLDWLTASFTPDMNMTAVLLAIVNSKSFVTRTFE